MRDPYIRFILSDLVFISVIRPSISFKFKLNFKDMNAPFRALCIILVLGLITNACSDLNNPVPAASNYDLSEFAPGNSDATLLNNSSNDPVLLNNYLVTFNDKSYDETTDLSTFSYTVSGTGEEPALNNFFIETPSCAGESVAYSPTQSAKITQEGIIWESSIPTSGSQDYSITYKGDLPVGRVDARIESGSTTNTKEIPGPCKGIFTISGNVFVDANENQQKEVSESGIQNVTVHLINENGSEISTTTTTTGYYIFTVFTGSSSVDFDVEVRDVTDNSADFNEQLFDSYASTTIPTEQTITVNSSDITGVNFGFTPQTQKLIQQFEDGTIPLNTEEPKFWIQQLRFAQKNNSKAEIPANVLYGHLEVIEGLLLTDPFQFSGNKFDDALAILTRPIKTDLEALLVQLLTAELNVVSGRGSSSLDFDLALLAYGESAASEAAIVTLSSQKSAGTAEVSATVTSTSITDANSLLTSFNFSGGGGGVGNK